MDNNKGSRPSRGVTFIELLVVLSIISILVAMAAPSWDSLRASVTGRALAQQLGHAITFTRNAAMHSNRRAVMCTSISGQACEAHTPWEAGWIVFVDDNLNGQPDATEPMLMHHRPTPSGWRISGNTPLARHVNYTPTGHTVLNNGAFQAGTFTLCHARHPHLRQQIVINRHGRPRRQAAAALAC